MWFSGRVVGWSVIMIIRGQGIHGSGRIWKARRVVIVGKLVAWLLL